MINLTSIFISLILLIHGLTFEKINRSLKNRQTERDTYMNPVYSYSMPDPTVIKAADGYFYLFATEDIRNTPVLQSSDLTTWKLLGTAFTDQGCP